MSSADELKQAYLAEETRKRDVFQRICETNPQWCYFMKDFLQPLPKAVADKIVEEEELSEAYEVFGSAVLERSGMSFSERIQYKLTHAFRAMPCIQFLFY